MESMQQLEMLQAQYAGAKAAHEQAQARARPSSWDRIAALQDLQDRDLLRQFMAKQQRIVLEAFRSANPSAGPAESEKTGASETGR